VNQVASALQEESFAEGEYIITQGEEGDKFYIIAEGNVKCTSTKEVRARMPRRGTGRQGEICSARCMGTTRATQSLRITLTCPPTHARIYPPCATPLLLVALTCSPSRAVPLLAPGRR